MTKDGYPTKKELDAIKEWNAEEFIDLFYFASDLWAYDKPKGKWAKDILGWYFEMTFVTCGWSGNESIIDAILKNFTFNYWYYQWVRGGKHVFRCRPENASYKLVSDYCKENSISRQAIYKSKHLYKFIKVSPKIVYVKKA